MFDKFRDIVANMKNSFNGVAAQPARLPYGTYYHEDVFNNFGEQVIFFATSGSSGFMSNGMYHDISGAKIVEGEFIEVISQAGIPKYLEPGAGDRAWRGEAV